MAPCRPSAISRAACRLDPRKLNTTTQKSSVRSLKLAALELNQGDRRLIITRMKAGDLAAFTQIDHYDSTKKPLDPNQGYQRPVQESRANKFANWLRKEEIAGLTPIMPSALLVSSRGDVVVGSDGTVTLSSDSPLFLVDGQHRMEGFKYAIQQKGMEHMYHFEVPVVIMSNVDKTTEMEQFRIVNGTQKSVRTDLVNMILSALAEARGDKAIDAADAWRVVASRCVEALNKDVDGPWFDRIVMPDSRAYNNKEKKEDPKKVHLRIVRATSFMTSLRSLDSFLRLALGEGKSLEERSGLMFNGINSFWKAVRTLNPQCFAEPGHFVIQKTPGLFSLHTLCHEVMADMFQDRVEWTEDNFVQRLKGIDNLCDPQYWASKHPELGSGEASLAGSMKGFADLGSRLLEEYRDSR